MQTHLSTIYKHLCISLPFSILLAAPTIVNAQVRVLALGDSITQGTKGQKSYRHPLIMGIGDALGCSYEMVGSRDQNNATNDVQPDFVSYHEGYSGHRADWFTEGRASPSNPGIDAIMDAETPDIVLIHLGSNDMRNGFPVGTNPIGPNDYNPNGSGSTIAELDQLVTQIWSKNANAELFVANLIPWYGTAPNSNVTADVQDLGDEIETWISTENNPRLHLVDVRSGYDQGYTPGASTHPRMISDLVHPNSDGEAHIADAFLAAIEQASICASSAPGGPLFQEAEGATLVGGNWVIVNDNSCLLYTSPSPRDS